MSFYFFFLWLELFPSSLCPFSEGGGRGGRGEKERERKKK